MPFAKAADRLLPYLILAVFFTVSYFARPLIPVDETRYVSVAWEMWQRHSFVVPTLNFEPYFQKPPLLFWLIDLAWAIFGVSRAVAMGVIFAVSSATLYLTKRLSKALFPNEEGLPARVHWVMLGSAIFAIYATLILFDLLLTVCVLAFMLALISFARGKGMRHAVLAGLWIGLGVLAKGPVVLIHIALPILLYPLWRDRARDLAPRRFYAGVGIAFGVALIPVVAWLGPALYAMGGDFAYHLIWRQAAGRISGNLESAHARPFYFYLLVLPIGLLPWIAAPDFWRAQPWQRLRDGRGITPQDFRVLRFLVAWIAAVFLVFSVISGKQPHYLVPVLPPLVLFFGFFMKSIPIARLRATSMIVVALFCIGQAATSTTILRRYDMTPIATFFAERPEADLAMTERYQGEVTFLARLTRPIEIIDEADAGAWLAAHPGGYLIDKSDGPSTAPGVRFNQVVGNRRYWSVYGGP